MCGRIDPFDLGLCAQCHDGILLALPDQILFDLTFDLIKARDRTFANILDLDDVEAELAFDGIGNIADFHRECGGREFGNHSFLGEIPEIATFRARTRILGNFAGNLGKIFASLEAGDDSLRRVFCFDEDVTGANFRLRLHLLD